MARCVLCAAILVTVVCKWASLLSPFLSDHKMDDNCDILPKELWGEPLSSQALKWSQDGVWAAALTGSVHAFVPQLTKSRYYEAKWIKIVNVAKSNSGNQTVASSVVSDWFLRQGIANNVQVKALQWSPCGSNCAARSILSILMNDGTLVVVDVCCEGVHIYEKITNTKQDLQTNGMQIIFNVSSILSKLTSADANWANTDTDIHCMCWCPSIQAQSHLVLAAGVGANIVVFPINSRFYLDPIAVMNVPDLCGSGELEEVMVSSICGQLDSTRMKVQIIAGLSSGHVCRIDICMGSARDTTREQVLWCIQPFVYPVDIVHIAGTYVVATSGQCMVAAAFSTSANTNASASSSASAQSQRRHQCSAVYHGEYNVITEVETALPHESCNGGALTGIYTASMDGGVRKWKIMQLQHAEFDMNIDDDNDAQEGILVMQLESEVGATQWLRQPVNGLAWEPTSSVLTVLHTVPPCNENTRSTQSNAKLRHLHCRFVCELIHPASSVVSKTSSVLEPPTPTSHADLIAEFVTWIQRMKTLPVQVGLTSIPFVLLRMIHTHELLCSPDKFTSAFRTFNDIAAPVEKTSSELNKTKAQLTKSPKVQKKTASNARKSGDTSDRSDSSASNHDVEDQDSNDDDDVIDDDENGEQNDTPVKTHSRATKEKKGSKTSLATLAEDMMMKKKKKKAPAKRVSNRPASSIHKIFSNCLRLHWLDTWSKTMEVLACLLSAAVMADSMPLNTMTSTSTSTNTAAPAVHVVPGEFSPNGSLSVLCCPQGLLHFFDLSRECEEEQAGDMWINDKIITWRLLHLSVLSLLEFQKDILTKFEAHTDQEAGAGASSSSSSAQTCSGIIDLANLLQNLRYNIDVGCSMLQLKRFLRVAEAGARMVTAREYDVADKIRQIVRTKTSSASLVKRVEEVLNKCCVTVISELCCVCGGELQWSPLSVSHSLCTCCGLLMDRCCRSRTLLSPGTGGNHPAPVPSASSSTTQTLSNQAMLLPDSFYCVVCQAVCAVDFISSAQNDEFAWVIANNDLAICQYCGILMKPLM